MRHAFRCCDSDAKMKFMRRTDSIFPSRAKLAALSVVGLSLSTHLAAGSSLIHETVEARSVSDYVDVWMPALKGMASMEISRPKRIKEAGSKAFAQPSESNESSSEEKKAVGCYVNNVWYPEGAIYPPQEPGKMTGTVVTSVCRRGKWIIRGKDD